MNLFSIAVATGNKNGFKNIRSSKATSEILLSDNYTLYDWLNNPEVKQDYKDNLYGVFIAPFIRDEDEKQVLQYIDTNYHYVDNENKNKDCLGLITAEVYDTACISLASSDEWKRRLLTLQIIRNDAASSKDILNAWSKECFDSEEIRNLIERREKVTLRETTLVPDDKKIHISDHHGIKELTQFWNRLKKCKYVEEGRSTNWGGQNFIRKKTSGGVIEIVLTDSEKNYALWVQTTGKNLRETEMIADYIQDHFE